MHKYLRAIGFSEMNDRAKFKEILTDAIMTADRRAYTMNSENVMLGEFCKDFADGLGIAVCGEFDEEDKFIYEYYYPYLRGDGITTREDVSVERHAARDSYAGVVEDVNMGISMIFYLQILRDVYNLKLRISLRHICYEVFDTATIYQEYIRLRQSLHILGCQCVIMETACCRLCQITEFYSLHSICHIQCRNVNRVEGCHYL